jgi:hypothetical protein
MLIQFESKYLCDLMVKLMMGASDQNIIIRVKTAMKKKTMQRSKPHKAAHSQKEWRLKTHKKE